MIYVYWLKEKLYFCRGLKQEMMQTDAPIDRLLKLAEQKGVYVGKRLHGFDATDIDIVIPHVMILLCLRGTARVKLDMMEMTFQKNDFAILLPGHVLRRMSCSEDFIYACVLISAEMFEEMKALAFSHNYAKFNSSPKCCLTDVQVERMIELANLLDAIASHDHQDLLLRRQMLLSQLVVGLEFINYYRREQDKAWSRDRSAKIYTQFCDLVVEHYRESRNVNYYAEQLGYDARYFSKVFRQYSNGFSPLEWIQQYVAMQAKRIIDTHPEQTVKETAYQLGFSATASFCRYFKHVVGIYPQEYRERAKGSGH